MKTNRIAISNRTRFIIFKLDKFRCRICGNSADDGARLEVDHKLPVSKGGTNDLSNLWTLCYECNRGKNTHIVKPKIQDNFYRSDEVFLLPAPKAPYGLLPAPKTVKVLINTGNPKRDDFLNWLKSDAIKPLVIIRMLQGLSQTELAKKAGVNPSLISRIETKKGIGRMDNIAKISNTLNVKPWDIKEFAPLFVVKKRRAA
jgi:DNA-binding Xre family transcriptional regulator